MIAITNLEVSISVFNNFGHNKSITIYTPGFWKDGESFKKVRNRSKNFQSKQSRRRRSQQKKIINKSTN